VYTDSEVRHIRETAIKISPTKENNNISPSKNQIESLVTKADEPCCGMKELILTIDTCAKSNKLGNDDQVKSICDLITLFPDNLVFSIEKTFQDVLNKGEVPKAMLYKFESNGIKLSKNASVSIVNSNEWTITDESDGQIYTAKIHDDDILSVYTGDPDSLIQRKNRRRRSMSLRYINKLRNTQKEGE
jgi:hypothetical protein